jgi:hypothetical protein
MFAQNRQVLYTSIEETAFLMASIMSLAKKVKEEKK